MFSGISASVQRPRRTHFFLILLGLLLSSSAHGYKIYRTGSALDIHRAAQPMTCLAGGASDDLWAEGWRQMLLKSYGGDIVIIRADGRRGGYENWIYQDAGGHQFPRVNSVSTLLLEQRSDGYKTEPRELLENAEMIFFAGGDQSLYLSYLKGTPLEQTLNIALHRRHIPFGGTSAGMAILGDIDFSALYPSPSDPEGLVTSEDVMKDPTGTFVDIPRGFITPSYLHNVVTDTHFSQRQRQGRLIGFMAKAVFQQYSSSFDIRGIGADEGTALCFDKSGKTKVFGVNSVYFLKGNSLIERLSPGTSLDWYGQKEAIKVYAIRGDQSTNATFDLRTWSGTGGEERSWYVDGSQESAPFFGEK